MVDLADLVYFGIEEAIRIHRATIEKSGGGTYEAIETGKLESVLEHIQNDDYYPSVEDKLTHLFWGACKFHCFADGNKRIALTNSKIEDLPFVTISIGKDPPKADV